MTVSHKISKSQDFDIMRSCLQSDFELVSDSVYKIILHLISLLAEQHELMIFKSESNIIHRTDSDYISIKHHFNVLNSERMRRLKFKANEFYIMIQSVRQISCNNRSVKEAV